MGDTKEITLNGGTANLTLNNYKTWVYILGFDHNEAIEGKGIVFGGFKTAQTSGIDIALCDSGYNTSKSAGQWFNMNNANSNAGGWASCTMRSNALQAIKNSLSSDLISVIKTSTIYSDNTGGGSDVASYVTATQDNLYLLAEYEILGSRTYANSAEQNYQQQYAYYVAGNSKIKYKHSSTATAVWWWERSVTARSSFGFCYMETDGTSSDFNASFSLGFAPAFRVCYTPPHPISNLSVGSSVFCNVNGVKTEFIVVNQGKPSDMYDDSCNGAWLLMKDVYENTAWNSYERNTYETSTIHSYLNSTFFGRLDSNIQEAVKQVKIPYVNGTGGSAVASGANGLSCKVFLLSGYEVGCTSGDQQYLPQDGAKLDYFESGTGTSANNKRIANLNGSATNWWLRSPRTSNANYAWDVDYSGYCHSDRTYNTYGMRPALILPFDTLVDSSGNIVLE